MSCFFSVHDIERLCHKPDGLLVNFFTHRFFATYVGACSTMHEDVKIVARAARVLADQTRLVRLRYKGKYIEFDLQ